MKRFISIFCIFILFVNLFAFPITVKADSIPVPGYSELKDIQHDIENGDNRTLQDIWKVLQPIGQAVGVIMNPVQTIEFIRDIVDPVSEGMDGYPTNGTDTEKANYVSNYLNNNITINDSSKNYTLTGNSRAYIDSIISKYRENVGMEYGFSVPTMYNISNISNGDLYNAIRSTLNSVEDGKLATLVYSSYNSQSTYYIIVYTYDLIGLVANGVGSGQLSRFTTCKVYSWSNWEQVTSSNLTRYADVYKYDSNSKSFNQITSGIPSLGSWSSVALCGSPNYSNLNPYYCNNPTAWNSTESHIYKIYSDLNTMKAASVGESPYYINNTVYNNYNNTSGDYTVNIDNSNHATWGDINTHIDDSFNTGGRYPTPTEIEIYIENVPAPTPTPTPTPDNPSGNGTISGNNTSGGASASATANNSGVNVTVNNNHNINLNVPGLSGNGTGSGTVSGNGNGSGGIFDWISDIGSVIGEFIKNVGQLIADVVKGITKTITTILADIPNIISVLVEFVYGGLPDELKAIVTLGITTVIFVGVIKMMRK